MNGKAQRKMIAAPMTDPIVAPTIAPVDIDAERGSSAVREDSRAAIVTVADDTRTMSCKVISKTSESERK